MEYGTQTPANRLDLLMEKDALPLIDGVADGYPIYGRLPQSLTPEEIDSLELVIMAAEERRNPSRWDAISNGQRAAFDTMFSLALESIVAGDMETAENIYWHFKNTRTFNGEYLAYEIKNFASNY